MLTQCPLPVRQSTPSDAFVVDASELSETPQYQSVLNQVEALAHTVTPGNWAELNLDAYFGIGAEDLCLKEMLLPFTWVARQQLIARVGAAYQQLPLPIRISMERELLATLNTLCLQGLKAAYPKMALLRFREVAQGYGKRNWLTFANHYPQIAQSLAETLLTWVESMVRLVDSLER